MTPREGPPRLARALLDALLSPEDAGAATGDLDEEYRRYVLPSRGRLGADVWYWRQVLLSAPRLVLAGLARRSGGLASLRGDLRFAARVLRRRPGLACSAIATLALGLAANTLVFSVVETVLLRPLPFEDEDALVRPVPDALFFLDSDEALRLEEGMSTLSGFAAWGRTFFTFTSGGAAEEVRGAMVSWSHFDVLGVSALHGRTFVREDAETGTGIVLGHGLWLRRFGGDPGIVGREVDLAGRTETVLGVLPADHVPLEFDWQAWRALPLDPERTAGMGLAATGRLRDGVTIDQASEELRRVLPGIWAETGYVASEEERAALLVTPLRSWLLGDAEAPLLVLLSAVGFLLLLASANVAHLMLAQGTARRREFAVRAALGGGRGRLVRQVLVEVGLIGVLGGALGVVLASVSLDWFVARLPEEMPRAGTVGLSATVLLFSGACTLLAATLTGVAPAWRASGRSIAGATRTGRGAGSGREQSRLRAALVTAEMGIAVVLVVGAGLMVRTLATLGAVDPGFDPELVVTFRPTPPSDRYPEDGGLDAYYDEVTSAVAALPGVVGVGAIQFLPMTPGGWWSSYLPEGRVLGANESRPNTAVRVVREGYFEAMGVGIRDGRVLTVEDGEASAPPRLVVNESFAREAFPGADPVGRSLLLGETETEIVGVVRDVRQSDLRTESHAEVYLHFDQRPWRRMHVVARLDPDAPAALAAIAGAVRGIDPSVPLLGPRPMSEVVGATLGAPRLITVLLGLFGGVGLGLGAIGVYGVTAQSVAERRREIGIRLALGAAGSRVTRSTVLEGLAPVALGVILGLLGARTATRLLESLLFEVAPTDPATFVMAPSILLLVAVLALLVPALRASRIDPVRSLREE